MRPTSLYLGMSKVGGNDSVAVSAAQFPLSGEAVVKPFFSSNVANGVTGAVAAALVISALALCLFLNFAGRRLGMKRLGLYPLATFAVGLSFGLPLFLAACARRFEQQGTAV